MNTANQNQTIQYGVFLPYDSKVGTPVETNGVRFVTCTYKGSKDKDGKIVPAKRSNVYTAIPDFVKPDLIAARYADLEPHFVDFLNSVVDSIVKEAHSSDQTRIYTEYLNIDKVLEKLNETSRLNSDDVSVWFDAAVADILTLQVAERLGVVDAPTNEQATKINAVIDSYRKSFASLAGGKTVLSAANIAALETVIKLAECGDSGMGARLLKRLDAMKSKKEDVLFSL